MKDIWKNSAQLLSANVVAQAIGLLVYPILTRMFGADDFGLLNLFLSIGAILIILSTADYQNAIVLPKTDMQSRAVFHVGVMCLIALMVLILCSLPFSRGIASLFKVPDLAHWLWLLPIYVLVMGLWNLLNNYYTRQKAFTRVSGYQLSQSVLSAGSKIGLGSVGFTSGGLIVGSVFAPLASVGLSIGLGYKKWLRGLFQIDQSMCKQMAKEYINFPKFSLPRSLVNSLGGNLPMLILTPFFGLSEMGYFAMALTLGFRPLNMISGSLYQTFFQQTAERVNERQSILPFFKQFIGKTLLIAVPVFVGLWFILPWLTQWLLGAGWEQTGELIRVMLPWLLLIFIGSSVGFISDVFQKQKTAFIIELIYLGLRIVALLFGIQTHSFKTTIIAYAAVGTIVILFQILWYFHLIRDYEHSLA